MTESGLDQRLRQRSRRAGLMIGLSMAFTIALCVAGFSVIYAALDNTIGDFVSRDVPTAVVRATQEPTTAPVAQQEEPEDSNANANEDEEDSPDPLPTTEPAEPADEATEAADTGEFTPDYQSSFEANLNFRSEPSTSGGGSTVIQTLEQGTLLEFTGEREDSTNPAVDGQEGWMFFELEDGTEGWLRAIDVSEYDGP
jgi:hypothetical protein